VRRSLLFPAAVLTAALFGLSACGGSGAPVANVNGEAISRSSVYDELRAIQKNTKYLQAIQAQGAPAIEGTGSGTFNPDFVAQIVNQRIILTVVKQELAKRNIHLDDEDLRIAAAEVQDNFATGDATSLADAFPKAYRQTLAERAATVTRLQADVGKVKIDDPSMQAYFDAHKADFAQTCVRHILVDASKHTTDAKQVADGLYAQLKAGADFATLAKDKSEDPGSAPQGGALGCDLSKFISDFSQAASKLQVNEISQPVQTQFGYHIIQVTSRADPKLDDAARARIRAAIVAPAQPDLQQLLLTSLDKAKVTVDKSIGTFQKGENGQPPTIVPPAQASTSTTAPGGGTPTSSPPGSTSATP
jgi:parvulin-like peptidyl-prolyl isomerase